MVKGEIDVATAPELRRQLEELADSDPSTLTLDMSGVTFIDSSGLGVLVGFLQHLREQNRDEVFVLAGLPGPARKVFDITGLGDHFRVR
jgi:anti-sigma B factor antagonist